MIRWIYFYERIHETKESKSGKISEHFSTIMEKRRIARWRKQVCPGEPSERVVTEHEENRGKQSAEISATG